MDHPLEVVVGVLLLCGVWGYVRFVAWHGIRWNLRAAHDRTLHRRVR